MKTTATNRRIRELLSSLRTNRLIPRPEFQRRLVWNNKDKSAFLETVLLNYPFPEIYVAAGSVDLETGEGTELLVDGQQRLTTLLQYFTGSANLALYGDIKSYAELHKDEKEAFLQYDVVVRDLGRIDIEEIKGVFRRINATKYALNAMEIHNSRYEGEFKAFAETFAQRSFFDIHRVFAASDVRRMQDVRFTLNVIVTALSTYFNRDDELEDYLQRFNDEFPMRSDVERELDAVLEFIDAMALKPTVRIWKKADLFTAIIEIHSALFKQQKQLEPTAVSSALSRFYASVDDPKTWDTSEFTPGNYYISALQASNDRGSRIARGAIIRRVLDKTIQQPSLAQVEPSPPATDRTTGDS